MAFQVNRLRIILNLLKCECNKWEEKHIYSTRKRTELFLLHNVSVIFRKKIISFIILLVLYKTLLSFFHADFSSIATGDRAYCKIARKWIFRFGYFSTVWANIQRLHKSILSYCTLSKTCQTWTIWNSYDFWKIILNVQNLDELNSDSWPNF